MQSGRAKTRNWVVEPILPTSRSPEPLMGWASSRDTLNQVSMKFDTKEEAIAYARRNGHQFVLCNERERSPKPKAYADNFRYDRIGRWTH